MAPFQILAAFIRAMPPAWTKQVHFDLDLTWQNGAPDGNMREMIFMNDQFPGPELRLNQGDGDDVEVVVHNSLPFNITVHFHGIEQRNTASGPDVQQSFRLSSSNEHDIEAIKEAEKNPQLVTVSDWGHLTSGQYQKAMEDSRLGVFVLINDRGAVFCPGTEKIFNLELSYLKTAIDNQPLRDKGLSVASSPKSLMFSIDEPPMYIYEVDGSYIVPQIAQSVTIFNDYTIHVPDTQGDQIIPGFATMRYKAFQNTIPSKPYDVDNDGRNTSASVMPLDNRAIKPYPPVTIPKSVDQLVNLTIGRVGSAYMWSTFGGGPHVMHKHSNKAFILGVGPGFFNWSSTEEEAYAERPELFQVENPQMRDTFVTNGPTGPTWMIVRYQVVNPGPLLSTATLKHKCPM
ncbi:Multicopper oxidase type 2, partial [Penicillium canescens]